MVIKIINEGETKNFWIFKELGEKRTFDIPKEQLAEAFEMLESWQENKSDCFTVKLFELMAKADPLNFRNIFNGFRVRATAYCLWYHTQNKEELQKYFKPCSEN